MNKLEDVIFYKLERAVRTYRQFAQREIRRAGLAITIDQWLTMQNILENPDIKQHELAEKVFKDNASVTRIIELLVKAGYLSRSVNEDDRRRSTLAVTKAGVEIAAKAAVVVGRNRKKALYEISNTGLRSADAFLKKVTDNCDDIRPRTKKTKKEG